jgi:putative two-component system response regulator
MDVSINSPLAFLDFLVEHFDPHGEAHATSVSSQAVLLARSLGMSAGDIEQVELAAKYHDFGKIAIPEAIRRNPGIYTPLERHAIQKHSEYGAQMIQFLNFHPQVVAIVLSHHENYDGSGYPAMLRREQIPIGARIIRIIDSFDALIHSRGYRPACSKKRALEKLHERSTHYDPEILDLFEKLIKTSWIVQS